MNKTFRAILNLLISGAFLTVGVAAAFWVDHLVDERGLDGQWYGAATAIICTVLIMKFIIKKGRFIN